MQSCQLRWTWTTLNEFQIKPYFFLSTIPLAEESLISEASPQLPSHPPVGAQFSLPVGSLPVSLTMDFGGDGLSHTTTLDPFPPEGQVKK